MNYFSERLKELRKSKGITQKQLSNAIGVTERAIVGYESGKMKPAFDAINSLADFFGTSTDYLIGRDEGQNKGESYLLNNYRNLNADNRRMLLEMSNFLNARQGFSSSALAL